MAKRHELGKGNYQLSVPQNVDVWIREGFREMVCMEKPTLLEGATENQLPGSWYPRLVRGRTGCQMENRLTSPHHCWSVLSTVSLEATHVSTHTSWGNRRRQRASLGSCSQNQKTGTPWHRKVSIVYHRMGNSVAQLPE